MPLHLFESFLTASLCPFSMSRTGLVCHTGAHGPQSFSELLDRQLSGRRGSAATAQPQPQPALTSPYGAPVHSNNSNNNHAYYSHSVSAGAAAGTRAGATVTSAAGDDDDGEFDFPSAAAAAPAHSAHSAHYNAVASAAAGVAVGAEGGESIYGPHDDSGASNTHVHPHSNNTYGGYKDDNHNNHNNHNYNKYASTGADADAYTGYASTYTAHGPTHNAHDAGNDNYYGGDHTDAATASGPGAAEAAHGYSAHGRLADVEMSQSGMLKAHRFYPPANANPSSQMSAETSDAVSSAVTEPGLRGSSGPHVSASVRGGSGGPAWADDGDAFDNHNHNYANAAAAYNGAYTGDGAGAYPTQVSAGAYNNYAESADFVSNPYHGTYNKQGDPYTADDAYGASNAAIHTAAAAAAPVSAALYAQNYGHNNNNNNGAGAGAGFGDNASGSELGGLSGYYGESLDSVSASAAITSSGAGAGAGTGAGSVKQKLQALRKRQQQRQSAPFAGPSSSSTSNNTNATANASNNFAATHSHYAAHGHLDAEAAEGSLDAHSHSHVFPQQNDYTYPGTYNNNQGPYAGEQGFYPGGQGTYSSDPYTNPENDHHYNGETGTYANEGTYIPGHVPYNPEPVPGPPPPHNSNSHPDNAYGPAMSSNPSINGAYGQLAHSHPSHGHSAHGHAAHGRELNAWEKDEERPVKPATAPPQVLYGGGLTLGANDEDAEDDVYGDKYDTEHSHPPAPAAVAAVNSVSKPPYAYSTRFDDEGHDIRDESGYGNPHTTNADADADSDAASSSLVSHYFNSGSAHANTGKQIGRAHV